MIKHSQYFTEERFATALVSLIRDVEPKTAIELGIGNGALSMAALVRWPKLKVDAVDIDYKVCESEKLIVESSISVKQGDVLDDTINYYGNKKYDLALCNPPFVTIKKTDFNTVFKKAHLPDFCKLTQLSADVVFVAKEMLALKRGGIMAVILPDGLLTRKDYLYFRQSLIRQHKILHVVQLPEMAFTKTEAKTHIVILQKDVQPSEFVPVSLMDSNGDIVKSTTVRSSDLENRMDFSFCNSDVGKINIGSVTLKDVNVTILRGLNSYKELRTMNFPYLHSNSFKNATIIRDNVIISRNVGVQAHKGDIIMCRVGKRTVGKVCFIKDGTYIISDCLFIIRIPEPYNNQMFRLLSSDEHHETLRVLAHGVCAQVISKIDLEKYIISLMLNIRNE